MGACKKTKFESIDSLCMAVYKRHATANDYLGAGVREAMLIDDAANLIDKLAKENEELKKQIEEQKDEEQQRAWERDLNE